MLNQFNQFRSIISGNMDPSVQVGVAACGHYIFVAGLRRAEFVLTEQLLATEQVSREKVRGTFSTWLLSDFYRGFCRN